MVHGTMMVIISPQHASNCSPSVHITLVTAIHDIPLKSRGNVLKEGMYKVYSYRNSLAYVSQFRESFCVIFRCRQQRKEHGHGRSFKIYFLDFLLRFPLKPHIHKHVERTSGGKEHAHIKRKERGVEQN